MRFTLRCENPDDIEYTMTITMTAKRWEELKDQLVVVWPSSDLRSNICDLLGQAREVYWPNYREDK